MRINLGVLDVPYNRPSSYKKVGRRSAPRRSQYRQSSTTTTGELSDILERRYGIMEFFVDNHAEEFVADILEGYAQNMVRPERGQGSRTDYAAKSIQRGEELFRKMLDNKELDGQVAGVPTMASQRGYRFGRSNKPGRPSFVDTGLYRDSFRITVEE